MGFPHLKSGERRKHNDRPRGTPRAEYDLVGSRLDLCGASTAQIIRDLRLLEPPLLR
jgi:hypothetical protein